MSITLDGTAGITTPAVTGTTGTFSSLTVNSPVTYFSQPAPVSFATSATLTVANLLTGIITSNATVTLTMPNGPSLEAGLPVGLGTGLAFEFSFTNTGSSVTITFAGNTGATIVGFSGLNTSSAILFRVRKTATATYIVYRVAG